MTTISTRRNSLSLTYSGVSWIWAAVFLNGCKHHKGWIHLDIGSDWALFPSRPTPRQVALGRKPSPEKVNSSTTPAPEMILCAAEKGRS